MLLVCRLGEETVGGRRSHKLNLQTPVSLSGFEIYILGRKTHFQWSGFFYLGLQLLVVVPLHFPYHLLRPM